MSVGADSHKNHCKTFPAHDEPAICIRYKSLQPVTLPTGTVMAAPANSHRQFNTQRYADMANENGNAKLDRRDEVILALIALLTPLAALPVIFGV